MQETIVYDNGKIQLSLPERFTVMTEEDQKALGAKKTANQFVAKNTEDHMIYNITWKKIPFFAKRMSLVKVIKTTFDNTKHQLPSLIDRGRVQTVIDGEEAFGFRYGYVAKEIKHISEYLLVRHNGYYIAFICTGREESYNVNYLDYKEMLESVTFLEG